jgi:DNA-3-methyladenine glycosylase II
MLPFRLDLTVWALRRRPKNEIDTWDGDAYRRVVVIGDRPVLLEVSQTPRGKSLQVRANGDRITAADRLRITGILEHLLGLRIDLTEFYAFATKHPKLNELVLRFKGLKPPRFASVFEGLVNGIACQQLSLEAGLTLLNHLSRRFGLSYRKNSGVLHAFPRPEEIASARLQTLRALGFSTHKAIALKSLSRSISAGSFHPERLHLVSNQAAIGQLQEIQGIGRWTAEYVLLRGLGRYDLFPGDDVGARAKLAKWLGLKGPMDYLRVQHTLAYLGPYRGLVYFHLLLDGLQQAGQLYQSSAFSAKYAKGA